MTRAKMKTREVSILGTRGVPASHGGFETFAERLSLYLVSKGWKVTVYCQGNGGATPGEDNWKGVRRVIIPAEEGAAGTIKFDLKSVLHASKGRGVMLTLGYNTAVFSAAYRLKGIPNVMNMDGIEWKREKWSAAQRAWLYLNERLGCVLSDHLIADHPEIKKHLATRVSEKKITMIPYGADLLESADERRLKAFGVEPGRYCLCIARAEPENSILEIVRAFSEKTRSTRLVVLGKYEPQKNAYHARVMESAGPEVLFPGAIYEKETVDGLRFHCRLYIHGHKVGGTNPSLVESLGAGAPVLAHDNPFNRWVAGPGALYFKDQKGCAGLLDRVLEDDEHLRIMKKATFTRHAEEFVWEKVLDKYERLLLEYLG